eukprot:1878590-Prymnesium_polylepis.1
MLVAHRRTHGMRVCTPPRAILANSKPCAREGGGGAAPWCALPNQRAVPTGARASSCARWRGLTASRHVSCERSSFSRADLAPFLPLPMAVAKWRYEMPDGSTC